MQAKLNAEKTDWTEFPYLESHEDVISVQRGPSPAARAAPTAPSGRPSADCAPPSAGSSRAP